MELLNTLCLTINCPIKAQNAGLFMSRGVADHPTRIIESHELIFVKQGELDMWENGQAFHLEAGQTLHLWPGRQHGSTKPMPIGLKFYWIHFEVEDRNENERGSNDEFAPLIKLRQANLMHQPAKFEPLFRMLLDDPAP